MALPGDVSHFEAMQNNNRVSSGLRLLRAMRDPRIPTWIKFLPLLALVYLVMPIDIIPDPILIVGWLDDLLIVVTLVSQAMKAVDRHQTKSLPPASY